MLCSALQPSGNCSVPVWYVISAPSAVKAVTIGLCSAVGNCNIVFILIVLYACMGFVCM